VGVKLRRRLGALLLLVALVLGTALRAVPPSEISDLRPRPDAFEYEEAARNLAEGEGYVLIVDGAKYAPRYPPGLPFLIAPMLRVWDAGFGSGIVVVLACALLTIVGGFVLGALAAGPVAGGVAALLLAVSPEHVVWSRVVMSDIPSACAVTWVLGCAALVARRGRPALWGALGVAIGLSTLLRLTNLAVAAPVAVCAFLAASQLRSVVALGAGVAVGLVPLLAYQRARFGSLLGTGYHLWAPEQFFDLGYVAGPPAAGGTEPNAVAYTESLLGFGPLYPWPIALLVALGLIVGFRAGGRRRELALLAAFTVASFFLGHVAYFWQDPRFLLPALPALLAAAGSAFAAEASRWVQGGALALTVVGLVSLAGPGETYVPDNRFGEPQVLAEIAEHVPPDGAILVRTNEAYFRRLLRTPGSDRLWVQLGADPHELSIRMHRIRPEEEGTRPDWIRRELRPRNAVAMVSQLLESGRPVYLSTLLAFQFAMLEQVLIRLNDTFRFELVASTGGDTVLFRILPRDRTPRRGSR
jgi:4-amino-4-deoxy-L-arabinose transferase-like glycosyltransferase